MLCLKLRLQYDHSLVNWVAGFVGTVNPLPLCGRDPGKLSCARVGWCPENDDPERHIGVMRFWFDEVTTGAYPVGQESLWKYLENAEEETKKPGERDC